MTDDLVAFLKARLDEDEQMARDLDSEHWYAATDVGDEYNIAVVTERLDEAQPRYPDGRHIARCGVEYLDNGERRAEHIARHDPARVLAEVEAKRAMVDKCEITLEDSELAHFTAEMLRLLAWPYADHPDYRPDWVPPPV